MSRIRSALILTVMVLAACGPAPTATATASAAASSTGPAPTASTASPSSGSACPTAADVETVIGAVTAQQGTASAAVGGVCIFTSNGGGLLVTLTRAPTRADFDNTVRASMPGAQAESGLGDAAYSTSMKVPSGGPSVVTLAVLKGSTHMILQASSQSKDVAALLAALKPVAKKVADSV